MPSVKWSYKDTEWKHCFMHGRVTTSIFFIIFSLSIIITVIPLYIIRDTNIGIDGAIYSMCSVELLLAVVSYSIFFRRLSGFQLSPFSTRQYFSTFTLIITLQIIYILISGIGLHKSSPVTFDLLSIVTMVFVIPVYEELFYRGCLFGLVSSIYKKGYIAPAILSSIVFSFMHMQFSSALEYTLMFVVGLILTYTRIITKGLLLPILLHSSMNAFALIFNFLLSK